MARRSILKRIVSRAAGLYPNTFFYGAELRTRFNGVLEEERSTEDGQKMSLLAQASMMMSVACSARMQVGDVLEATHHGVTYRGEERGSYKVRVERVA